MLVVVFLAGALGAPAPARADSDDDDGYRKEHRDDDDHDREHRKKKHRRHDDDEKHAKKRKHRYDDGNCKYTYERDGDEVKEKWVCKDRRVPPSPPPVARRAPSTLPDPGIDTGRCNRERLGQLLGGAIGGAVGSRIGDGKGQVAATAVGAVIGVIIGGQIGRSMDELDQGCVGQVLERAPDQRVVTWTNPDQGDRYEVTPTHTFTDADGRRCRDFRTRVESRTGAGVTYGTACQRPDGTWERVY